MIREILAYDDPVLRQKSQAVDNVLAIGSLISDMLDTIRHFQEMRRSEKNVGLAAPQLGITKRVVLISQESGSTVLINPEIVSRSAEYQDYFETCMSFPGLYGLVRRSQNVVVNAWNEHGEVVSLLAEADLSMLVQHEIDHLDGILFSDHLRNGKDDLLTEEQVQLFKGLMK